MRNGQKTQRETEPRAVHAVYRVGAETYLLQTDRIDGAFVDASPAIGADLGIDRSLVFVLFLLENGFKGAGGDAITASGAFFLIDDSGHVYPFFGVVRRSVRQTTGG